MMSKADKLPLETEPVARDNNTILTLKPGDQTMSRFTQLIMVVVLKKKFELSVLLPKTKLILTGYFCIFLNGRNSHHRKKRIS